MRTRFRVLKIERNEQQNLELGDDGHDYSEVGVRSMCVCVTSFHFVYFQMRLQSEVNELLRMIKESSKSGIIKIGTARGLLGFVRFLEGYYLLLVTKRRKVGELRGHGIYTIEATSMLPFSNKASTRVDEAR